MLAVRIPDEMEIRLDKLATLTGRPKSYYVREALQVASGRNRGDLHRSLPA